MDYEKLEKECMKIREENLAYLDMFEKDLVSSGIRDTTVKRHVSNVRFYLNTFLLHEDALCMRDGTKETDMYFGDFFIRRCAWSTPASIKSAACSLKKFYRCMAEHDLITPDDYQSLCNDIRDLMPVWLDLCEQYNDPCSPSPFDLFGGSI